MTSLKSKIDDARGEGLTRTETVEMLCAVPGATPSQIVGDMRANWPESKAKSARARLIQSGSVRPRQKSKSASASVSAIEARRAELWGRKRAQVARIFAAAV